MNEIKIKIEIVIVEINLEIIIEIREEIIIGRDIRKIKITTVIDTAIVTKRGTNIMKINTTINKIIGIEIIDTHLPHKIPLIITNTIVALPHTLALMPAILIARIIVEATQKIIDGIQGIKGAPMIESTMKAKTIPFIVRKQIETIMVEIIEIQEIKSMIDNKAFLIQYK